MIGCVYSSAVVGIEGFPVRVEADIGPGLKEFNLVGLPDGAIRESVKRVHSAIKNAGFKWPRGRVTINLSPAGVRKDGTGFDLPIAMAVLIASGQATPSVSGILERTHLFGELSLDSRIMPVPAVLPRSTLARELGIHALVLPQANAEEAGVVEEVATVAVSDLEEAVRWLEGRVENRPKLDEDSDAKSALTDADCVSQEILLAALRAY
jgi:magnesium chelatase family protein